MKLALTLAAGMLAASSFAFAADNNGGNNNGGGKNDGMTDKMNTGSIDGRNDQGDLDDATKCREGTAGGAPCQELGTGMQQ